MLRLEAGGPARARAVRDVASGFLGKVAVRLTVWLIIPAAIQLAVRAAVLHLPQEQDHPSGPDGQGTESGSATPRRLAILAGRS